MACFKPLRAWRAPEGLVFQAESGLPEIKVACGRCVGCRLERSRQWAIRMMQESRYHDKNSFITLTYDEDHVPRNGSLNPEHFKNFIKRLRKDIEPRRISFFHCGEYGEDYSRPHYHAIIFGEDFRDQFKSISNSKKRRYQDFLNVAHTSRLSENVWSSDQLSRLWPFGFNYVGNLTFESAAYVARYVLKKVTGEKAESHYERVDEHGECHQLKPEYCTMSRRPAIGKKHFEEFVKDIYPRDEISVNGRRMKPPKYYDRALEKDYPELYDDVKAKRECALAWSDQSDNTSERLRVREVCFNARIGTHLKRR